MSCEEDRLNFMKHMHRRNTNEQLILEALAILLIETHSSPEVEDLIDVLRDRIVAASLANQT